MRRRLVAGVLLLTACVAGAAPKKEEARHKLLVVSVDGLDWRYLRDRDAEGERIPNMRRLLAEGAVADGVTGVWPTITWPSHTSLITGMRPDEHGILGNRRPKSEGGAYYWSAKLLKGRTLLDCAAEQGRTTATVTWPVTVDAPVTWDLPEYFDRRNGGSMDMLSVGEKAVPAGLVAEISKDEPSFPQQWMDDRTRALAAVWLLEHKRPDLLLVHLVDLDSDEHDLGPFNVSSRATLERTDALLGEMLRALPKDYDVVLLSDHGFERVDHVVDVRALLAAREVTGEVQSLGGLLVTKDAAVAAFLKEESAAGKDGIGRVVPEEELRQYAPVLAGSGVVLAVAPAEHFEFSYGMGGAPATAATHDRPEAGGGTGAAGAAYGPPVFLPPPEKGNHGFWPVRGDYGSVFVLAGPGVRAQRLGRIEMVSIKDRLAGVMGMSCPTAAR